jgi:hypothetical protein
MDARGDVARRIWTLAVGGVATAVRRRGPCQCGGAVTPIKSPPPLKAHPLDGAFDRVARAETHLANLKVRIRRAEANLSLVKFSRKGGRTSASHKKFAPFRRPAILSILVGEIIYNLRAALDYLVYELARLGSGQTQEMTQFPIESSEDNFRRYENGTGLGKGRLKGVRSTHIALIKKLQPCHGCKWTERLATISNSDKHRLLTVLLGSAKQTSVINFGSSEFPPNRRTDRLAPKHLHVQRPTLFVKFADGGLITERLDELTANVAETLQVFKPEFK